MEQDIEIMNKTIQIQRETIDRLTMEIKELKAMIPILNKEKKIILPARITSAPSSSSELKTETAKEFTTDEDELVFETKKNAKHIKKRRRTATKSPPKTITPVVKVNIRTKDEGKQNNHLPPPIYVSNIYDFNKFRKEILSINKETIRFRALSNNNLKITIDNSDDYREVKKLLDKIKSEPKNGDGKIKNIEYHTYQMKEDRTYRFIIRGLPSSIQHEDIKHELEELEHEVKNISNIYKTIINKEKKKERIEFPLFSVEIKQKENNKDIFNIKYLAQCKVTIEPPKKANIIPQCTNCQQLGHTKSFCKREPICVKCALSHHYKDCKKLPDSTPKCALCQEEGHTANYKGCVVYQNKVKSVKANKTTMMQRLQAANNKNDTPSHNMINPGTSFAQAARKNLVETNKTNNEKENTNNTNNNEVISLLLQIQKSLEQLSSRVDKLEAKAPKAKTKIVNPTVKQNNQK